MRRFILILQMGLLFTLPACLHADLLVSSLGKLPQELSEENDKEGSPEKWEAVQELLGAASQRVIVRQTACDQGGNTSVRNRIPHVWKQDGYFRRSRDLGQVFMAPEDFTLDALVLRTGNDSLAFLPGAAGAEVFIQFFEVEGDPHIDDNGTPPGSQATHGFSTNHRCDDIVRGVTYRSIRIIAGGRLPDLSQCDDGKLTYMVWDLDPEPRFEKGRRYAFMVGFSEPAPERNFTLGNRNTAASTDPPAMDNAADKYPQGWSLRREGNGKVPPRRIPGETPPDDPAIRSQLERESTFPKGSKRFEIPPTCEGYPDVDTYRDLEFYLIRAE